MRIREKRGNSYEERIPKKFIKNKKERKLFKKNQKNSNQAN